MNHCPQEQISALIDRQLGTQEEAQVELHLRRCENCRKLREELTAASQLFRNLETLEPPHHLWTRIGAELDYPTKRGRLSWLHWQDQWFFHRRELVAIAALLILMIGSAIFIVLQRQASTRLELAAMARIESVHTALIVKNPEVYNPFRKSDWANPDSNPFARNPLGADTNPFGSMKEKR